MVSAFVMNLSAGASGSESTQTFSIEEPQQCGHAREFHMKSHPGLNAWRISVLIARWLFFRQMNGWNCWAKPELFQVESKYGGSLINIRLRRGKKRHSWNLAKQNKAMMSALHFNKTNFNPCPMGIKSWSHLGQFRMVRKHCLKSICTGLVLVFSPGEAVQL